MQGKLRGFTLIELLVVVVVIGLLVAILLPSLAAAREQAKTMKCAANMRSVGQIVFIFAESNDGRSPSGGADKNTYSLSWNDILNYEVLKRSTGSGLVGTAYATTDVRTLSCTNFVEPFKTYNRPYVYNAYAVADPYHGAQFGLVGNSSLMDEKNGFYPSTIAPLTAYSLGAKLQLFRPDQFLIYESYGGNYFGFSNTADSLGRITAPLLGYPSYNVTDWSSGTGIPPAGYGRDNISFRHPFFRGANFLFMDGHAATLKPTDDVSDSPIAQAASGRSHFVLKPGS